jgi:hypothetical protein
MPRLTDAHIRSLRYGAVRQMLLMPDNVSLRINEDCGEAGVVIGFTVEQQYAGISRDGHLDFVGNLQTTAAFEIFFIKKHKYVSGPAAAGGYTKGHFSELLTATYQETAVRQCVFVASF